MGNIRNNNVEYIPQLYQAWVEIFTRKHQVITINGRGTHISLIEEKTIMNNSGKVFLAGTITGVLFAPKKGSETREDISKKVDELSDKVSDLTQKGQEMAHDLKDQMQENKENQNGTQSKSGSQQESSQKQRSA